MYMPTGAGGILNHHYVNPAVQSKCLWDAASNFVAILSPLLPASIAFSLLCSPYVG
jgi:hypothetical protein